MCSSQDVTAMFDNIYTSSIKKLLVLLQSIELWSKYSTKFLLNFSGIVNIVMKISLVCRGLPYLLFRREFLSYCVKISLALRVRDLALILDNKRSLSAFGMSQREAGWIRSQVEYYIPCREEIQDLEVNNVSL